MTLEVLNLLATVVGVAAALATIWVGILDAREARLYSRRKNAEEKLSALVLDELSEMLHEIEDAHGWSILIDQRGYEEQLAELDSAQVQPLDRKLRRLLQKMESLAIYSAHGLIDDDLCADYLASIAPTITDRTRGFIEKERRLRGNNAIFRNFVAAARRWSGEQSPTHPA